MEVMKGKLNTAAYRIVEISPARHAERCEDGEKGEPYVVIAGHTVIDAIPVQVYATPRFRVVVTHVLASLYGTRRPLAGVLLHKVQNSCISNNIQSIIQ
jgi:hypothetical protein